MKPYFTGICEINLHARKGFRGYILILQANLEIDVNEKK